MIALGHLGWSLRPIEEATGVRPETVGEYLRKAGVVIRLPAVGREVAGKSGRFGDHRVLRAGAGKKRIPSQSGHSGDHRLFAGFGAIFSSGEDFGKRCANCQELIEAELSRGRNAMGSRSTSGRPRVREQLPERPAVRAQSARGIVAGSSGDHRNAGGRRGPG